MPFAEILDTGFRIVRDHPRTLFGIAALVWIPSLLLQLTGADSPWWSALWIGFAYPFVDAAATAAIGELYLGRSVSIATALGRVWSILGKFFATILLQNLFIGLGFVCLILPGLYLVMRYFFMTPIMIFEGTFGRAALERSRVLMRGYMWRAAAVSAVALIFNISITVGATWLLEPVPRFAAAASTGIEAATYILTTAIQVVMYFDARCRKEAFDLEHLAQLVEQRTAAAA